LLDLGLGAILGNIVDEPLAWAGLARTAGPARVGSVHRWVIISGIAGFGRGEWERRGALSGRRPFLSDPGGFADEQQENDPGHGQDARAATGPNSFPARCEFSEGDGFLNHGHHPVRDGQAQGPRSNWVQRNAMMNVFKTRRECSGLQSVHSQCRLARGSLFALRNPKTFGHSLG
jgi:hypothetical protein